MAEKKTQNRTTVRTQARILMLAGGMAMAISGLGGCSPVTSERGYVFDPNVMEKIHPGQTSKQDVRVLMGSPSAIAAIKIEGDSWYYITSKFETLAFFPPEEVDRRVVAIYFDAIDQVQEVGNYGLEDGQIVSFVGRKTPTRGKELTVLGQIFGNLGRFNKAGGNAGPGASTPGKPGKN